MATHQRRTGQWRGSDREQRDQERRERLLAAALEVYGTTGYAQATVHAVCAQAHVSTRSFYELFTDQEELLQSLYRILNNQVISGLSVPSAVDGRDLNALVRSIIQTALGPALQDERVARVLEVESVGVSPAMERERRRTYRALAQAVDLAFEALRSGGLITTVPGGMASLILVGGMTEALVQRVQQAPEERMAEAAFLDELARVALSVARGWDGGAGAGPGASSARG